MDKRLGLGWQLCPVEGEGKGWRWWELDGRKGLKGMEGIRLVLDVGLGGAWQRPKEVSYATPYATRLLWGSLGSLL